MGRGYPTHKDPGLVLIQGPSQDVQMGQEGPWGQGGRQQDTNAMSVSALLNSRCQGQLNNLSEPNVLCRQIFPLLLFFEH